MAKSKSKSASGKPAKPKTAKQLAAQEAIQVTWELKGCLKKVQLTFLRAAKLLARVREEKLYLPMKHATIEEYAQEHLRLEKSSLYKYLRVYDWVKAKHPDWLEKTPEGDMPDLNDIADAIQIDKELARTNLDPDKRKTLDDMQKRAEKGELSKRELSELRKGTRRTTKQGLKGLLSKFYAARRQVAGMKALPPDILVDTDALIGKLKSLMAHDVAGFHRLNTLLGEDFAARFS
jgi:hypothetical protein